MRATHSYKGSDNKYHLFIEADGQIYEMAFDNSNDALLEEARWRRTLAVAEESARKEIEAA